MNVALIDMPFYHAYSCSTGLALLKSYLDEAYIHSKCFYFNVEFAIKIGCNLYSGMAEHDSMFDANWVFTKKIFDSHNSVEYLSKSRQESHILHTLQRKACSYIDELVSRDWSNYNIIGLSTFPHQMNAALALGKGIKEKHPEKIIIYGGAGVSGNFGVEYIKHCPWIDVIFLGESDYTFPQFCKKIKNGHNVQDASNQILGVAYRNNGIVEFTHDNPRVNMDDVAIPNYDDFAEFVKPYRNMEYFKTKHFTVGFETSRGCSIGIKKCCAFCSFVQTTGCRYSVKSDKNMLSTFEQMYIKYSKEFDFELCDALFPLHCPEEVLRPWINKRNKLDINPHARLWVEAKPWHSKEDIRLMEEAKIGPMHFGIEHLQSDALKSMRKKQTTIQCLSTLKWSKSCRIDAGWYLLLQIPGEKMEWHDEFVALIPKVTHLPPPQRILSIGIAKYSPYFYEEFNLPNLQPMWEYHYTTPPNVDINEIAYNYTYDGWGNIDKYQYVIDAVNKWKNLHFECEARLCFNEDCTAIVDSRSGKENIISISSLEKDMLIMCDKAKGEHGLTHIKNWKIITQSLIDKNLMLLIESRFFSLVELA